MSRFPNHDPVCRKISLGIRPIHAAEAGRAALPQARPGTYQEDGEEPACGPTRR
jgi:hypothetical protein